MILLPTTEELEELQNHRQFHSLSIYIPHIEPDSSDNPNRIQLKNALKEAHHLLEAQRLRSSKIDAILSPAYKLLDSDEFRTASSHSLALFLGPDFYAKYYLPSDGIRPLVAAGKTFHVQPLAELMNNNQSYYVLVLNHNNVGLLKGDQYHLERLEVEDLPTNMLETLDIDEYPKEHQMHSVAAASSGRGSEHMHAQYNKRQVDKDMLTEFFRRIDRRLRRIIKDIKTPLIISGAESILPLYRRINTYPTLLPVEIKGNMEHEPLDSLRDRASKLIATSSFPTY